MPTEVKLKVKRGRTKIKAKVSGKKAEELLNSTVLPAYREESKSPIRIIVREGIR